MDSLTRPQGRLRNRHILHPRIVLLKSLPGLSVPPPQPNPGALPSRLGDPRRMRLLGSPVNHAPVHSLPCRPPVGDVGFAVLELRKTIRRPRSFYAEGPC